MIIWKRFLQGGIVGQFAFTYNEHELILLAFSFGRAQYGRVMLPKGLVKAGRINNPALFSELLEQGMAAALPRPIHTSDVIVGFPEEQAFIKIASLPASIHHREFETVLTYQWQSLIPIPRDQVYAGYMILPAVPKEKKGTHHFLLVAYPKDVMDSLQASLNYAGLTLRQGVPLSFGYAAALTNKQREPNLIITPWDTGEASVVVAQHGIAQFSTTLHTTLDSPAGLKQLNSIRQYYEKNVALNHGTVAAITVTGTVTNPTTLKQMQAFRLPVKTVSTKEQISNLPTLDSHSATIALQGLLKHEFPTSLLPAHMQTAALTRAQDQILRSLLVAFAAIAFIALYLSLVFWSALQLNARTRVRFAPEYDRNVTQEEQSIRQKVTQINEAIADLKKRQSAKTPLAPFLAELNAISQAVPGITVTALTIDRGSTPQVITVAGTKSTNEAVEQLQMSIQQLSTFSGRTTITPASSNTAFSLAITINESGDRL